MERKKYLLIVILLLIGLGSNAQNKYDKAIYDCYVKGDMIGWQQIIKLAERDVVSERSGQFSYKSPLKISLINYYYGVSGWLISQKENKQVMEYIKKGEALIEKILDHEPDNATFIAYKAAFKGFRIGAGSFKVVYLGVQSLNLAKKAYSNDPMNIRALIEMGNVLYYSPSFAGGDKKKGIEFYEQAVKELENSGSTVNNWQYLSLLSSITNAYCESGQKKNALKAYEKAISAEPHFLWIKEKLYPKIIALRD
jgi:tetratricopeptide (TPR) repeat protein